MSDRNPQCDLGAARQPGDLAALAGRLGEAGLLALAGEPASLRWSGQVRDRASLQVFLEAYRDQVLLPRELPWILRAWRCAERYQLRELVELDQQLAGETWWNELAVASRHVGRSQLRTLKPLRDLRLLQRYRNAVEEGRAQGWHVVVYGLVLCAYSIPLRPGLMSYSVQTLGSFVDSAGAALRLTLTESETLRDTLALPLSAGVNRLLAPFPSHI